MNAVFKSYQARPSEQVRAVNPMPGEPPHHRAVEMADALREISNGGANGATFASLLGAGFTSGEVIEHIDAARALAAEDVVHNVNPRPDLIGDIVAKARAPLPNRPPLPRRTSETQALLVAWRAYCAAHSALILDPWPGQRERCLSKLGGVLDQTPLYEVHRREVIAKVGNTLREMIR